MEFYIGVTDDKWFHFLAAQQPDEVNFWRPRAEALLRNIKVRIED